MSGVSPEIHDDPAAAAAERLLAVARAGGHIALAGGSTPKRAYELAAAAGADWSGATIWFGDERCVPPDDERSNYGMAKVALLDHIGAAVKRIEGELGPDDAAAAYARELRATFPKNGLPRLDLILLGLGPDRHTASLFPGKPAVEERERWVVGVPEAGMEPHVPRVTMTFPLINAAHEVVFLVAGADKAEAVADAFGRDPGQDRPASLVRPDGGGLTLLLDPAAAARLVAPA